MNCRNTSHLHFRPSAASPICRIVDLEGEKVARLYHH